MVSIETKVDDDISTPNTGRVQHHPQNEYHWNKRGATVHRSSEERIVAEVHFPLASAVAAD